jgi:hypothetical protein
VKYGNLLHRIVVHFATASTEKNKKEEDTTSNNIKALHSLFIFFF